jgi:4,5-DOPA dioxygenase extradiol
MPALFVGHGSPMNAIEDNEFSRAWAAVGESLPRPQAILCISAHWETNGTAVTAMERPRTIHDFYGFPDELNAYQYLAPGSPALAELVRTALAGTSVRLDQGWGLDHGTWSVLCRMFPRADVPVVQLSLDRTVPPPTHYALGAALGGLRRKGVLIVGSGNIVHNLALVRPMDDAYDWAIGFDQEIKQRILERDHEAIVDYAALGEIARLAVPTNEHYLPLLYVLALQQDDEEVSFFAEKATLGSISMRSLRIG